MEELNKIIKEAGMPEKIFHHFAFTFFWLGILGVIISTTMLIFQWNSQSLNTCLEKGYSQEQCKGY